MSKNEQEWFLRGLAYSIRFIIQDHGEESLGIELLEISGYNYIDLSKAGCDAYDLEPIARALGLGLAGRKLK